MIAKESNTLEFKLEVTDTFLKTVSAFSNYRDGQIKFGVDDNGNVVGLDSIKKDSLKIEHKINDSVKPRPTYQLSAEEIDGKKIIVLDVFKGEDTPYYYNGKAYRRSDTSTVEVDRQELNRLVMEGLNIDYEENRSLRQDFEFSVLEEKLKSVVGIERLTIDILKTLRVYDKDGYYNMAGGLLADENDNDSSGIDIVRFGDDINRILDRETFANQSVLSMYDNAVKVFERYYQYEEVEGYTRVKKELIPKEAFREAIANALIHRQWEVRSHIQVAMYGDRIEINSPGGLPAGISESEYMHEQVSLLRNPILAGVFYRLDLIEQFGTGIKKILRAYEDSITKPDFTISENYIKVVLPVLDREKYSLTTDDLKVFLLLEEEESLSRNELDSRTGFNKSKTIRILNNLVDKNIVKKESSGPGTTYRLK